jgi:hypothetical protein
VYGGLQATQPKSYAAEPARSQNGTVPIWSDLWVKVEKRVDAQPKLRFDLFSAALENVHRHVRFVAVFQDDWSLTDRRNLIRRQQPHSIH